MRRRHLKILPKGLLLLFIWGWLLVDGVFLEPRNLRIETVEAALPGWPAEAPPARIVLLSDLHAALWDADWLDRIVETTLLAQPEAVVISGDFCFTSCKRYFVMPPKQVVEHLKPLLRQCPVYYVLGNHDLFRELSALRPTLDKAGFTYLDKPVARQQAEGEEKPKPKASDKDVRLTFSNGCSLWLRGAPFVPETVDGIVLSKRFPPQKEREHPEPLVCIAHNPYHFLTEKLAGDLILCGHTHGGQICRHGGFPLRKQGRMSAAMQRGGWHTAAGGQPLYISRGLGTTLIPIRLNCPPEITVMILKGEGN